MILKQFDIGPGSYFGGKGSSGTVHRIINQIPKHSVFVSGFLGRCQVMTWKLPASLNIGFDLDPAVIAMWGDARGIDGRSIDGLYLMDFLSNDWGEGYYRKDTFLYLDPPYLPETRTSRNKYLNELTPAQHEELLTKAWLPFPAMIRICIARGYQDGAKFNFRLKPVAAPALKRYT